MRSEVNENDHRCHAMNEALTTRYHGMGPSVVRFDRHIREGGVQFWIAVSPRQGKMKFNGPGDYNVVVTHCSFCGGKLR